jgi:L-asparaginase II
MAHAFARLELLEGGERVAAAMRAHPYLVGGPDHADWQLMEALPGWTAKTGAEGLLCAVAPGGLGIAVKTHDGAERAHRPALSVFLRGLGYELPDWSRVILDNSLGEPVGELTVRG